MQEELKKNPNPRVRVFDAASAPGFTDPTQIAQTTPILTTEQGFDEFERSGTNRLPRMPDRLTPEERAVIPELEATATEIEALAQDVPTVSRGGADALRSMIDQRVNKQLPILGSGLEGRLEVGRTQLAEAREKAEYFRAAKAGELADFDVSKFNEILSGKTDPEAQASEIAAARSVEGVDSVLSEAGELHQLLNSFPGSECQKYVFRD